MKRPVLIGILALALMVAGVVVASALVGLWRTGEAQEASAAVEPVKQPPEPRFPHGRIRVEVLNAGGRAGLAREATTRLRAAGFDVVFFGNSREFGADSSLVLDRAGEAARAALVARALGITRVESRRDPDLLLEATVVLGRDWVPTQPEPAPLTAADHIRRWFARLRGR